MSNACRHFLGLYPDNRPACAKGRDVRAWAARCNGGSELGIGLRLPCTKQTGDKSPLFNCPGLDRKTNAEVAEANARLTAKMDRFVRALPKISEMKRKMLANNLSSATATCPWCEVKDGLMLSIALGANNHVHAKCRNCDVEFLE